jgi:hypothetical protein
MPKGKRGSRGKKKSERLAWKVRAQIDRRVFGETTATQRKEISDQAQAYFLETGEQMEGVHLVGMWANPDRKNAEKARWKSTEEKGQDLAAFYATLPGPRRRAEGIERKPVGRARRSVPIGPATKRSAAATAYAAKLRELKTAHPSWTHKRAQAAYRKQRDTAKVRESKARAKAKAKKR